MGIAWNPHSPVSFFATTDNGKLVCYDFRKPDIPLVTTDAHQNACSAPCVNQHVPSFVATASEDGVVKLWNIDISESEKNRCKVIAEKNLAIGPIFSCDFSDKTNP